VDIIYFGTSTNKYLPCINKYLAYITDWTICCIFRFWKMWVFFLQKYSNNITTSISGFYFSSSQKAFNGSVTKECCTKIKVFMLDLLPCNSNSKTTKLQNSHILSILVGLWSQSVPLRNLFRTYITIHLQAGNCIHFMIHRQHKVSLSYSNTHTNTEMKYTLQETSKKCTSDRVGWKTNFNFSIAPI